VAAVPLRRNRDFVLLQAGQLLSSTGSQLTAVAYPLLVLAVTGSAAQAGVVGFARLLPAALLALPAGVAADRWDRRRLMVSADAVRVVAVGALGIAILLDRLELWAIALVALVEGIGSALFRPAYTGALRSVVPASQLPAAAGTQTGREAAVQLAGPPLGGALFGVARALPFLVDAVSYAFSTVSLLLLRTPFQEERDRDRVALRTQLAEGFRFLWGNPFLRTCALLFALANFIGPGLLLALVVIGTEQGLSAGAVGALVAVFAACILLGSFLSPFVRRLLPPRAVLLLELWTWPCCAVFLVRPSVWVLLAGMIPTALAIPSTDSVVHGSRIALTPDRLVGRVEAVWSTTSLAIAPLGPLLAGALLGAASPRATVAVFAGAALALALAGTLSPSLRHPPVPQEDGAGGA
jgi:Na+/melibiose symporter-like transporter